MWTPALGRWRKMKKVFLFIILAFSSLYVFAQDFTFPPELKWWIYEIQKIDPQVQITNFKFDNQRTIKKEKENISYKNRLFPVLKKWNYFGDKFAYNDIHCSLQKQKNGKYTPLLDVDSIFGIFDRDENLLFRDFFGSCGWIDSFCWLTDKKIIAIGRYYLHSSDDFCDLEFVIYEYTIKDKEIIVKEFIYQLTKVDSKKLDELNLSWFSQRNDYFEY